MSPIASKVQHRAGDEGECDQTTHDYSYPIQCSTHSVFLLMVLNMGSIEDEVSRCHEAGVPSGSGNFVISSGPNKGRTILIVGK